MTRRILTLTVTLCLVAMAGCERKEKHLGAGHVWTCRDNGGPWKDRVYDVDHILDDLDNPQHQAICNKNNEKFVVKSLSNKLYFQVRFETADSNAECVPDTAWNWNRACIQSTEVSVKNKVKNACNYEMYITPCQQAGMPTSGGPSVDPHIQLTP